MTDENGKNEFDPSWDEEYQQSHMDRMDAMYQIMNDVFEAHKEELDKFIMNDDFEGRDKLIDQMIDEIVEQSGGFIGRCEASEFIDMKLTPEIPAAPDKEQDTNEMEAEAEAYEQSHMERWEALNRVMAEVYERHRDQLMDSHGDAQEGLIEQIADEMVEESGGILMKDEALGFIRAKLTCARDKDTL